MLSAASSPLSPSPASSEMMSVCQPYGQVRGGFKKRKKVQFSTVGLTPPGRELYDRIPRFRPFDNQKNNKKKCGNVAGFD